MTAHPSTEQFPDLWDRAVHAPFLQGVRDGTLPPQAFDRWLAQDALFVADLLRFQARLLARAPRAAQAVLAAGAVALVDELSWFEDQAAARGLSLDAAPLGATREYAALLERLDAAPYPVAVTALWVVERVYLLAWATAAGAPEPYTGFVEHWTAPGFADYVAGLEAASLAALPDAAAGAVDRAVAEVLELEAAFWDAGAGA